LAISLLRIGGFSTAGVGGGEGGDNGTEGDGDFGGGYNRTHNCEKEYFFKFGTFVSRIVS
jgi:hypothetical protein